MNLRELSKRAAHALRHAPGEYGLALDAEGWVEIRLLAGSLGVTADTVEAVAATSSKNRFEVRDGLIRARYGHSVAERIAYQPIVPPDELFHGTSPAAAEIILTEGLLPRRRQYVHLSPDIATAREVGARKAPRPVILVVDALGAHAAGIVFYPGNEKTVLADHVPPRFIRKATP